MRLLPLKMKCLISEMRQFSKAIRNAGLRIIPGDLQDEAEHLILQTRQKRHQRRSKRSTANKW